MDNVIIKHRVVHQKISHFRHSFDFHHYHFEETNIDHQYQLNNDIQIPLYRAPSISPSTHLTHPFPISLFPSIPQPKTQSNPVKQQPQIPPPPPPPLPTSATTPHPQPLTNQHSITVYANLRIQYPKFPPPKPISTTTLHTLPPSRSILLIDYCSMTVSALSRPWKLYWLHVDQNMIAFWSAGRDVTPFDVLWCVHHTWPRAPLVYFDMLWTHMHHWGFVSFWSYPQPETRRKLVRVVMHPFQRTAPTLTSPRIVRA